MSNASNVSTKKGKITFSRLYTNNYQKQGSQTLEIKQIIKTVSSYPSKKYNSNLQDSLFSESDFGVETNVYTSEETRVAWILVPDSKTEDEIKRMVAALSAEACIYKVLSNEPILDDNQKSAIQNGLKTLDEFAMSQVVRYPDTHSQASECILDSDGNIQYRRTLFSKTAKEDIDTRGNGKTYVPEELQVEVYGANQF